MAAFRQHMLFSTGLGIGYAAVLAKGFDVEPAHGALAGGLCAASGMLPDLDSDSGRPIQEMFSLTAAVIPLLLFQRLRGGGFSPEETILFLSGVYLLIRFGAAWLFKRLTVHRGMFHSIPAAIIAAELVFLAHVCPEQHGALILGGGVLLGFLSHLVLDELSSVDLRGLQVRLNKAAGSALKLGSRNVVATMTSWLLVAVLTYFAGVKQGYFQPIDWNFYSSPTVQIKP